MKPTVGDDPVFRRGDSGYDGGMRGHGQGGTFGIQGFQAAEFGQIGRVTLRKGAAEPWNFQYD